MWPVRHNALPLRPLTTGELLDAAVVLLRMRPGRLFVVGAALALLEQLLLFPLRRLADVDARFLPGEGLLGQFGVLVVTGFATEAFCIAVLGGVAAVQAPRALLGSAAPSTQPTRYPSVVLVGLAAALVCGASAWPFLVLPVRLELLGLLFAYLLTIVVFWPFGYGLLGLSAPAVVVDRLGPARALGRSLRLTTRNMMRALWIRVLGYVTWLLLRFTVAAATTRIVEFFFTSPSSTVDNVVMGVVWAAVNALAYPMLGCLDVALHVETRMRTEGLDIALASSLRRGVATDAALAVPR